MANGIQYPQISAPNIIGSYVQGMEASKKRELGQQTLQAKTEQADRDAKQKASQFVMTEWGKRFDKLIAEKDLSEESLNTMLNDYMQTLFPGAPAKLDIKLTPSDKDAYRETPVTVEGEQGLGAYYVPKPGFEDTNKPIFIGKKTGIQKTQVIPTVQSLRKEFEGVGTVQRARKLDEAVSKVGTVWKEYQENPKLNKNALDQSLIIMFNKTLDEGSVVRESEYARTPDNVPFVNKWIGRWKKLAEGSVAWTDSDREGIVELLKIVAEGQKKVFGDVVKQFEEEANVYGYEPSRIIRGYKSEKPATEEASSGKSKALDIIRGGK